MQPSRPVSAFGLKAHRDPVDTIAQPCGWRAIGKDVAKMGIANIAKGLDTLHPVAGIKVIAKGQPTFRGMLSSIALYWNLAQ